MNIRTLLIIAGLALPIVVFAILSQTSPAPSKPKPASVTQQPAPATPISKAEPAPAAKQAAPAIISPDDGRVPPNVKPGPMSAPPVILPNIDKSPQDGSALTLQQAIEKVKTRLVELERITPEQWPEERKRHVNAPPTLQQALDYNRNRLGQLSRMTPEQWEAEQQKGKAQKTPSWNEMTPQQQLELLNQQQAKLRELRKELEQQIGGAAPAPSSPQPSAASAAPPQPDGAP